MAGKYVYFQPFYSTLLRIQQSTCNDLKGVKNTRYIKIHTGTTCNSRLRNTKIIRGKIFFDIKSIIINKKLRVSQQTIIGFENNVSLKLLITVHLIIILRRLKVFLDGT